MNVVLPSIVTEIHVNAFAGCSSLVSVVIPEGTGTIMDGAFYLCTSMKIINIPSTVTTIEDNAFLECSAHFNVNFNNTNYSSLDGVLFNKEKTTLITYPISKTGEYEIPSSVVTIGQRAFYNCDNLISVAIPSSVNVIDNHAFALCSQLSSIAIPSSVTSIGVYVFLQCSANINVDDNNANYSSLDGVLFNKDKTILIACPISKTGGYEIASSVLTIANSAFNNCVSLTSIVIPSNVTAIEDFAFAGCDQLATVTVGWTTPLDISNSVYVFYAANKPMRTLNVPFGTSALYEAANQWMDFDNIVEMAAPCQAISSFPYNQDFSTGTFPGCWRIVDNEGNGQVWTLNNYKNRTISTTTSSNGFIIIDSDYYGGNDEQNCDLISPVFDFSGFTNINLRFEHIWDRYAISAILSYSINNGNSWIQIQRWPISGSLSNIETFSRDLSTELTGQSQVMFKWSYNGTWAMYWAIDDIIISADEISILPNLEITNTIVHNGETTCFNAYDNITVAGGETTVVFEAGSIVDVIAGNSIRFLPGFYAENGSEVHAFITIDGSFCGGNKSAIVVNPDFAICVENEISPENQLADLLNKSVTIYPNPNNGQFFLEVSNFETRATVSIYNMLGSRVYESEITKDTNQNINLLGIMGGVYFVKVTDGKEQFTKKMIVRQ